MNYIIIVLLLVIIYFARCQKTDNCDESDKSNTSDTVIVNLDTSDDDSYDYHYPHAGHHQSWREDRRYDAMWDFARSAGHNYDYEYRSHHPMTRSIRRGDRHSRRRSRGC